LKSLGLSAVFEELPTFDSPSKKGISSQCKIRRQLHKRKRRLDKEKFPGSWSPARPMDDGGQGLGIARLRGGHFTYPRSVRE
jgi:hypothetical protein